MLTRSDILAIPADQLAEVSARMMGRPVYREVFTGYVHGETRTSIPRVTYFKPHTDHNDAREVADWVVGEGHCPISYIHICLCEVMPNGTFHWAWTPEQLTRAALLAFVDNGGEI